MAFPAANSVPEIPLANDITRLAGVTLLLRREDLVHPEVSGNKYWKLKYNLEEARRLGHDTVLTFGGAFSNHIAATAAACRLAGLKSIGVIRGEDADLGNPTLSVAAANGMTIYRVTRAAYREKSSGPLTEMLRERFGSFYTIPEGGTNRLAVAGAKEMAARFQATFDFLVLSTGTGGTITGCIQQLQGRGQVIGFSALKGDFLAGEVASLHERLALPRYDNWQINAEFHFGGYAKTTPELLGFIDDFEAQFGAELDQVYTGKMMFGVFELLKQGFFPPHSTILALHTGGLQGKRRH